MMSFSYFQKKPILLFPLVLFFLTLALVFYQNCGSPFEVTALDDDEKSFDVIDPFLNIEDQRVLLNEDTLTLVEAEKLLSSQSSSLLVVNDLSAHENKSVLLNYNEINVRNQEDNSVLSFQFDKKKSSDFSVFVRIKNIDNQNSEMHFNVHEIENDQTYKDVTFSFNTHQAFEWFLLDQIHLPKGSFELQIALLTKGLSVDQIALSTKNELNSITLSQLDSIDKSIIDSQTEDVLPTIAPTSTVAPTAAPTAVPTSTVAPTATPITTPTVIPTVASTPTPKPISQGCPANKNNLFLNPYNKNSAFHRPIGTGAQYAGLNHPVTLQWIKHKGRGTVNHVYPNGHPATVENPSDRLVTIKWSGVGSGVGLPTQVRVPSDWPDRWDSINSKSGDRAVSIIDLKTRMEKNFYHFDRQNLTAVFMKMNPIDDLGHPTTLNARPGSSAAGMTSFAGALRVHEILTPGMPIRHAHAIVVTRRSDQYEPLLGMGIQWPATAGDTTASTKPNDNTGPVPYGALIAIPPNVDLDKLSPPLSEAGRRLFQSIRDYGMIVIDGGGQINFRADGALPTDIHSGLRSDIRNHLHLARLVTNSVTGATATVKKNPSRFEATGFIGVPTWPAGGGQPLAPNCAFDAP